MTFALVTVYSSMWCVMFRFSVRCTVNVISNPEFNRNKISTEVHSPNNFRVNVVVSNMHEYAFNFDCTVGTKMNPIYKCQVWWTFFIWSLRQSKKIRNKFSKFIKTNTKIKNEILTTSICAQKETIISPILSIGRDIRCRMKVFWQSFSGFQFAYCILTVKLTDVLNTYLFVKLIICEFFWVILGFF